MARMALGPPDQNALMDHVSADDFLRSIEIRRGLHAHIVHPIVSGPCSRRYQETAADQNSRNYNTHDISFHCKLRRPLEAIYRVKHPCGGAPARTAAAFRAKTVDYISELNPTRPAYDIRCGSRGLRARRDGRSSLRRPTLRFFPRVE